MRRSIVIITSGAALFLAACGGTGVSTSDATSFWRQTLAQHYHGVVARGDGRGCARAAPGRWACTAYVRNAQNSLDSGTDIIGTVWVSGGNLKLHGHPATGSEIRAWFAKYRGVQ